MDYRYQGERDTFTILGIDPGSETIGYATIEAKIQTLEIVDVQAFTITGSKLDAFSVREAEIHSERYARISAHRIMLARILEEHDPLAVACESPFFNPRRPGAFGVLMEVLTAIQETVKEWDVFKVVHLVDPPTAKKALGAAGNAKKPEVAEAFQKLTCLHYPGTEGLDEHSIDALAVAYQQYTLYVTSRL